ncbi:MAG: hypothetical protein R3B13_31515 [Polyangiaceae bacterium]
MSCFRLPTLVHLISLVTLGAGCSSETDPTPTQGWHRSFDASEVGWLLSTWSASASDSYAVGGTESEGRVEHFDGKGWQRLDIGLSVPLLNWVHGIGDTLVVVGNAGTVLRRQGGTWNSETAPTTQNLWGVWGASADDLWSVGGSGKNDGDATLLHYDGMSWQSVALPAMQKSGVNALFKVWGTSASNVYAVGQKGAVLHYDGSEWKEELAGASDDLIALWGTGPKDIVAVGGRAIGIASVWDGSSWKTESLAPLPGLNGVWSRRPGVFHVVGVGGTLGVFDTASLSVREQSFDTELDVHGVFGTDSGRLNAVGGNFAGPVPPYQGIALERKLGNDE